MASKYEAARLIAPDYREGKKVKGLRDWEGQRARLAKLVERFGAGRIRSITFADIEAFRNELLDTPVVTRKRDGTVVRTKQRSIGDVHRTLALLRAVFTYATQKRWLNRNPFSDGEGLISMATEVARERVLTTDEQRRLLQACQTEGRRRIYPLVLTALDSGCRRGELLKLTWADVDLDKGSLTVVSMNAKTERKRVIDLEPVTVAELRKLAEANGGRACDLVFGIKNFWHAFVCAKAGLVTRFYFATCNLFDSAPIEAVRTYRASPGLRPFLYQYQLEDESNRCDCSADCSPCGVALPTITLLARNQEKE